MQKGCKPMSIPQSYKICPRCGQTAMLHISVCGRCGHTYRTQFAAADQTQAVFVGFPAASSSMNPDPVKASRIHPKPGIALAFILGGFMLLVLLTNMLTPYKYEKRYGSTPVDAGNQIPLGVAPSFVLERLGKPSLDASATLLDQYPSLKPNHASHYWWLYFTQEGGQWAFYFEPDDFGHEIVSTVYQVFPDGNQRGRSISKASRETLDDLLQNTERRNRTR
jgi:hypothetical protein